MLARIRQTAALWLTLTAAPFPSGAALADGAVQRFRRTYELPEADRGATGLASLPFTLTLPGRHAEGPWPLVLLYSGFKARLGRDRTARGRCSGAEARPLPQMKASFYAAYADALAGHGYAVAQYDLPLLKYLQDSTEVALVPGILRWLGESPAPGGPFSARLDMSRVGVAGHSRGGKLATLALAGEATQREPACRQRPLVPANRADRVQGTAMHSGLPTWWTRSTTRSRRPSLPAARLRSRR